VTQEWRDIIAFLFVGALQGGCIGFLVGRESVRREQCYAGHRYRIRKPHAARVRRAASPLPGDEGRGRT